MSPFRNTYNGIYSQRGSIPCNDVASAKQGQEYTVLEGNYNHFPHTVDDKANTLSFGGWEFDIRRTVYPTANSKQILDGWNRLVAAKIPMDLLFLSLFLKELSNKNTVSVKDYNSNKSATLDQKKSSQEEPESFALLRLCYWYHSCLQINDRIQDKYLNFNDKLKEIKEELGEKTKAKARSYGLPILADYGSNISDYYAQLKSLITYTIRNGNKRDKTFRGILDDIRYSIYRFLSECIFYTLVSEAGFYVYYCKIPSREAPELGVGCIPSAFRILLGEEIQQYHRLETITKADDLSDEILHILRRNRRLVQRINEALGDGSLVIFDTTGTLLGDVINFYARLQKNGKQIINLSIRKAIHKAIDMEVISRDHLPVIFLAQTYGNLGCNFISAVTVAVPCVVNDKRDGFEVDVWKLPE